MSRTFVFSVVLLELVASASSAHAQTYISWCFQWLPAYDDMGAGEDNLSGGEIPASYNFVKIKNLTTNVTTTVWLNSLGCTANLPVDPYTTYEFKQYTRAKKDDREVFLIPDGQPWESYITYPNTWPFPTFNLPIGTLPPHTFAAPNPGDDYLNRIMPVFTQALLNTPTLDWEDDVDIWVSTWGPGDLPGDPNDLDCGSWTARCRDDGTFPNRFCICIDNLWAQLKYQIAHEFGHTVSKYSDGPDQGSPLGDQGVYEADGPGIDDRCDCDVAWPGKSHCLGSREFTGVAQQEGFSHFIASAVMNGRETSTSVFMYYYPVMEPSWTHYYPNFQTVLPNPLWDPDDTEDYPYYVPIDAAPGTKVRWMEYECAPGGSMQHFGTEWDWLDFYWNLYTDGYPNRYTIAEINSIWDNIYRSRSRVLCCLQTIPFPPGGCVENNYGNGAVCVSPLPMMVELGKTWSSHDPSYLDCLLDSVDDLFSSNPTKVANFQTYGAEAGVDH